MAIEEHRFGYAGRDGANIAAFRWTAPGEPRAVLQVVHGAGEHSLRYLAPLTPIIEAGFVTYSADHRGHGATAGGVEKLGDFGPSGAPAAIEDMAELSRLIRRQAPGLPLFMLGHSMGGLFAQAFLHRHHALIDGLVLSGTAAAHLPRDPSRPGPNAAFPNPRTDYDWLSRDEAQVDAYVADPLCGIRFTPNSARSFRDLGKDLQDASALKAVRRDLPVLIFAGDADPIHDGLTRLTPLVDRYREAGLTDVTLKVYPGGRHEMLNETNRDEVVADLLAWLERAVAARPEAA